MSFEYQQYQPQRKPEPPNPFLGAGIGAVVVGAFGCYAAVTTVGEMNGNMPSSAGVVILFGTLGAALAGGVVGLLLGGRDWLAYKLSGGNPSEQLMSYLRAGTYASLILVPFGCIGLFALYTMATESNQQDVTVVPSPPPQVNPANISGSGGIPFPANVPSTFPSTPAFAPSVAPTPVVPPTIVPPSVSPVIPTIPEPAPTSLPSTLTPEPAPTTPASATFAIETGTPPKDAYEKFVAKYGESAVARIIVQVPATATGADVTIREALTKALAGASEPYVYVTLQGTTAAAIVAPANDINALAQLFGNKATVQAERRLVSLDFNDVNSFAQKQQAVATKEDADLQRLAKMVEQGDLRSKEEGYRQLSLIKTPAVAEYLVARLAVIEDSLWTKDALKAMGPLAQKPLLKVVAGGDRFASMSAMQLLTEIGTKEILPDLEALAKSRDFTVASQAKMLIRRIQSK